MDLKLYKDVVTSRALNYHYYFTPPRGSHATLLLLHGFPSTSHDWHHQVDFFQKNGYGLIVPDMLGYGGTDKPTDTADYKPSLMAKDVVEILDAENVEKVIGIAHDWGSRVISRLLNNHPERITAAAFLSVPYIPPLPDSTFEARLAQSKEIFGYELYGYQAFLAEEGAEDIITQHWNSFFSLAWADDLTLWKTDMAPTGAMKAWLLADKTGPLPSYLTAQDKATQTENLLRDGIGAPLNWYKIILQGVVKEDDASIPLNRYVINQPVLFIGCKLDYISRPENGKVVFEKYGKDVTYKEYDAGHWVLLSHAEEVNRALLEWIDAKQV